MMSPLIVWAALVASLPPGALAVVERGEPSANAQSMAELLRSRARSSWGPDVIATRAEDARFVVELEPLSSEACGLVVREGTTVLASRKIEWASVDLGLVEGWVVVRAALERATVVSETPDIPRPVDATETATAAAPAGVASASAPPTAPLAEVSPPAMDVSAPADGASPRAGDAAAPADGPTPADGAPSTAVGGPTTRASEPTALDYDPASTRLVDSWGLLVSSQLAAAFSAGVAVEARKAIAPRVVVTARLGAEWFTPVAGVSATRLPLTGMVGWLPVAHLPIELGAQVQLAPLLLSAPDGEGGGLGFSASVGGYTRGAFVVGPVRLFGDLGLGVPVLRHTYSTSTETATDPVLDFRLGVGMELRWP